MLNQVILVGRITTDIEIVKEVEHNKAKLVLAVQRSYKNAEGEYETDYIPVTIYDAIATSVKEYCAKGDMVGVKGRIQTTKMASENVIELIAEKVTFLSSKKDKDEE